MHEKDIFLLRRAHQSAEHWLKRAVDPVPAADGTIGTEAQITFGQRTLQVLETPGHTPGSVCFYYKPPTPQVQDDEQFIFSEEGILFTGDTLLKYEIGSTIHRYSSKSQILSSVQKILSLPGDTQILPGHGEETSVAVEHAFYRGALKNTNTTQTQE